METREAVSVAEILFRVRSALEGMPRKSAAKGPLEAVSALAAALLESSGERAGMTADDADILKLALMRRRDEEPPGLEVSLLEAASSSGCDGLIHRVVGRFAEFVNRAMFSARGEFKGIVEDDPWLPVAPWVKERGCDTGDLKELGRAFMDWTKASREEFGRRQSGRPAASRA